MTHAEQLRQAARLWLSPEDRDVAEIRLDDLLDADCSDAITEIHADGYVEHRIVTIVQESGAVTRIEV